MTLSEPSYPCQVIQWLAIPRGLESGKGKLNVYVLPDLLPVPGGTATLADFPDLLDWRNALVNKIKLSVKFGHVDGTTRLVDPSALTLRLRDVPDELADLYSLEFNRSTSIDAPSARLNTRKRRARAASRKSFDPKDVHDYLAASYRWDVLRPLGEKQAPRLNSPKFESWLRALHDDKKVPAQNEAKKGDAAAATAFRHIFAGNSRYPIALQLFGYLFELEITFVEDWFHQHPVSWVQVIPTWVPQTPFSADVCVRTALNRRFELDPAVRTTKSGRMEIDADDYRVTQKDLVSDYAKTEAMRMRGNDDLNILHPTNFGITLLWAGFDGSAGTYLADTTGENSPQVKLHDYLVGELTHTPLPQYQRVTFDHGAPPPPDTVNTLRRGWAVRVACKHYDTPQTILPTAAGLNYHSLCDRVTTVQVTNTPATVTHVLGLEEGWVSVNDITQTGSTTPLHFPAIGHWCMTGMLVQPPVSKSPGTNGYQPGNSDQKIDNLPLSFAPRGFWKFPDGTSVKARTMPQRFGFEYHFSLATILYDGLAVTGDVKDDANAENYDLVPSTPVFNLVTHFYRYEPIDPPVVWMKMAGNGETTETLVIFDGDGQSTRYNYPPSVGRILAERHGAVDLPPSDADLQLFGSGRPDEQMYSEVLVREHLVLPESGKGKDTAREAPYIPDPLVNGYQIVAVTDDPAILSGEKSLLLSDIRQQRFAAASEAAVYAPKPAWPHLEYATFSLKAGPDGTPLRVDPDTVYLARGNEAIVAIASSLNWDPDPTKTIRSMRPRDTLAAIQVTQEYAAAASVTSHEDAALADALLSATTSSNNPLITPPRMLRLIHAVMQPIGDLSLQGRLGVDISARNRGDHAASFTFIANVPGKTANDFRITANWTEWTAGSTLRPPTAVPKHAVLVSVRLRPEDGWGHGLIDAQLSDVDLAGNLARERTFDFGSARAIRLSGVQLHAASRFSAYYPTSPPTKGDRPFDLTQPPDPTDPLPYPAPPKPNDVIVPATASPQKAPLVAFALPVIDRAQHRDLLSGTIEAKHLGSSFVLNLASWNLSGDDEQLLIYRDQSTIYRNPATDAKDAPALPPLTDDAEWDFGTTTHQDAATVRFAVSPPQRRGDYFTAIITCRPKTDRGRAVSPWLRLALASYQPHCIDGIAPTGPKMLMDFVQLSDDRTAILEMPTTTKPGCLTVSYPATRNRIAVQVQQYQSPGSDKDNALFWRTLAHAADPEESPKGTSVWTIYYQDPNPPGQPPASFRVIVEEFETALAGIESDGVHFDQDVGRRKYFDIIPLTMT
ncbi:MAG: hypothetical protein JOZ77_03505 [Candidatus Eremiobacteraeota bacterium]|nr:hypothetical protein [Candidatus Eremiobacteraeota bacterium]